MPVNHQTLKWMLISAAVVLSLILILIISSFSYLDFYMYGFKRQRSTARVFTNEVYGGGRYMIGPDFDFKTYPASAQHMQLPSMSVTTKDTLEVELDVMFQYLIRPSQLEILHQKYQLTYDAVIRSSAMDALKAAAVHFNTTQFIKDRNAVEKAMKLSVKRRISGNCCEADCKLDECLPKCIPLDKCTKEVDMGLMVNLRHFVITRIDMPYKVYRRYLKALLLVEESQREEYRLEEAVVKKEVDEAVKIIGNQAREVAANATAKANLITKRANAESVKIVGSNRSEGLRILMSNIGIEDEKKKMSLFYLNSLSDHNKAHLAVDFNNFVIGGAQP